MAQRTFSSPLRISDISLFSLLLQAAGLLSFHLNVIAANSIDVGIHVPTTGTKISAVQNQSLILNCPIQLVPKNERVKILDVWWIKDEVKLDPAVLKNSGHNHTNCQQHQLTHVQTTAQTQYNSNSQTSPSSASSTCSSRVVIINRDLHFEKVDHKVSSRVSDEGKYRCVVKTNFGLVFSPVVTVEIAPDTEANQTQEVKVKANEPALLDCHIFSSKSNLQLTWICKDNVTVTQGLDARYYILSSGTLAISSVSRADAGEYRCVVREISSKVERISSSIVRLVVLSGNDNISSERPKILSTPTFRGNKTVLILEENESTIMDCVAGGIPQSQIHWIMSNNNDSGTKSLQSSHSRFFLNSINISSELLLPGTSSYVTCIADNRIEQPVSRTVQVYRLPALLRQPISFECPPAKTIRFKCKVQPIFSLLWYKDGQQLETGKGRVKVKGNELVISNTIQNDSGFYQCEVIADRTIYAVGTARLHVHNNIEAPEAPTNLECLQTQSSAFSLSWKPPARVEDIISYSVHYMSTDEERQLVVSPRTTNITISSLLPHMKYNIYIKSYSKKSASAPSHWVTCKTSDDVPNNKLLRVEVEQFGPPDQVRLIWRPLSNADATGNISLYKLRWRSFHGLFSNVRHIDGASKEFLIMDLSAGRNYKFQLFPITSVGGPTRNETWPWVTFLPAFDAHDATRSSTNVGYFAPPSLHLTVLNATSVLLNWSEPPRPKEVNVKGFHITYSTRSDLVNDSVFFGPITIYNYAAREYLIAKLAPRSTFKFYLQTWGDHWESYLASKFIGTFTDPKNSCNIDNLGKSIIPVITGLQVHRMGSHKVRLQWNQPLFNTSAGYFYTVIYNKVDNSDVHSISSTEESAEITELAPYTFYEFVVQLTLGDGCVGPYSQRIESQTLPGIPGVPVNLHSSVHNQSAIEVKWEPPLSPNGLIIKYWVEFGLNSETQNLTNNKGPTSWLVKTTVNTSIFLNNLRRNELYVVRVKAETKGGRGYPTKLISVKISNEKPEHPPPRGQPKLEKKLPLTYNEQTLGVNTGVSVSAVFILVTIIIIVYRNRLFPLISPPRPGAVCDNENNHSPRARKSQKSPDSVEMNVLVAMKTHLDLDENTKFGNSVPNRSISRSTSARDPLLVHVSLNTHNMQKDHRQEDKTAPNYVH